MSTATVMPALEGRGLSPLTLMRVELRKQVDTRGGRGLLLAIGLITVLALGLVMYLNRTEGASLDSLLAATVTPQGLLLPVLGIITACNEWSQRTALVTFTQEPRRLRVVLAKLLAAVVLGTVAVAGAVLLAMLAHVVSATIAGAPVHLGLSAGTLAGIWLSQSIAVVMGVAFGLALLSVPLAITAYFILPTLFTTVSVLWSKMAELGPWLDMGQASSPLQEGINLTLRQWSQLGTSSLLWLALPLAVGLWRVMTREVK
ncbi:hypothetical protein [Luteococcus peritonei]|uniref:ABC transporter permease n=1 Tax=Luteococcus peritonei TaxID=88874 RepID=A0ABW4RWT3_9ACTN